MVLTPLTDSNSGQVREAPLLPGATWLGRSRVETHILDSLPLNPMLREGGLRGRHQPGLGLARDSLTSAEMREGKTRRREKRIHHLLFCLDDS